METKKITVKEILIDKCDEFKNRYWYKVRQLISTMYKKYPKGFYVNAKRRLNDTR